MRPKPIDQDGSGRIKSLQQPILVLKHVGLSRVEKMKVFLIRQFDGVPDEAHSTQKEK